MNRMPLLMIAAGGTGGHMFPAQALAETMLRRGWRVMLTTDDRGARFIGSFPDEILLRVVKSGTFSRGSLAERVAVPLRLVAGTCSSLRVMLRDRPGAVAGFGGYPAVPAMAAAVLCGIPTLIHEQNGVLGRANRMFVRRVDHVALSIWPMSLPEGVSSVHTGNPVRNTVRAHAGASYSPPGDGAIRILVVGGSQGARILSEVVPDACALLPESVRSMAQVTQQAREADVSATAGAFEDAGVNAKVASFFDDIPRLMAETHLVISRAGASTVAEIAAIGRPSILIPFAAAVRDEQSSNARLLTGVGAAVVFHEKEFTPAALAESIMDIVATPGRASSMAEAASMVGRPRAAETLGDLVEDMAKGRSGQ